MYTAYAGLQIPVDFGRRATAAKNGNAGPKLHWRLWEKCGFLALPFGRSYAVKSDTPI